MQQWWLAKTAPGSTSTMQGEVLKAAHNDLNMHDDLDMHAEVKR